jgi:hypothetical protein
VPEVQLQVLETHCSPPVQAVVQEPQWPWSLVRSTHEPLQSVVPVGHSKKHVPEKHEKPAGQRRPHPPQLAGSFVVFVQTPEQSTPEVHPASASAAAS